MPMIAFGSALRKPDADDGPSTHHDDAAKEEEKEYVAETSTAEAIIPATASSAQQQPIHIADQRRALAARGERG